MIGLVNNMPDAALEATEHQFERPTERGLARSPADALRFFCLKEIERGERAGTTCAADTWTSTVCPTPDSMD